MSPFVCRCCGGFSTLNRVYVLGTIRSTVDSGQRNEFQYPQSGLCAWNVPPRAGSALPRLGFSTLNRVYVLGTDGTPAEPLGDKVQCFSTLNRVYVLGTPDVLSPAGRSCIVSVPSIGFMCLERLP